VLTGALRNASTARCSMSCADLASLPLPAGAVRSFGRTLAVDPDILARRVRVNVLTPGATATALTAAASGDDEVRRHVSDIVPMGRWGDAREIARVAQFLASDASS
jgi:NAD(P)-dependent dehydrogenase (short-subunit alcohol dehydrogenase family)